MVLHMNKLGNRSVMAWLKIWPGPEP